MEFSSQGCTGAYCLDQCSGLLADLPNVDGFKYRYYFSGECSDLTSLPVDPRPSTKYAPFSFGCYKVFFFSLSLSFLFFIVFFSFLFYSLFASTRDVSLMISRQALAQVRQVPPPASSRLSRKA